MIKDKKKLPHALAEKQELQRQETINKVLRAVADIKSEGGKITISTLAEYTGLSRSTFAKQHIRELLAEYGCASGDVVASTINRKKTKQSEVIAEKDKQLVRLRVKNERLEKECELLRGKLFLIIQKTTHYSKSK